MKAGTEKKTAIWCPMKSLKATRAATTRRKMKVKAKEMTRKAARMIDQINNFPVKK